MYKCCGYCDNFSVCRRQGKTFEHEICINFYPHYTLTLDDLKEKGE